MFSAPGLTKSIPAPSGGTSRLDFCPFSRNNQSIRLLPGAQSITGRRVGLGYPGGLPEGISHTPLEPQKRIPAEQWDFCTQTGFQRDCGMGRDQESLERSCGGTPPHPSHGILSSHIPESPPEGLDPNKPHGKESRRFPISHLRGAGKTCSRKTPTGKEMDLERALLAEQETLPTFLPGSWFHSKCSSLQPCSMFLF